LLAPRLVMAERTKARQAAGAGVWRWDASDRPQPVRARALHVVHHPF
jgi:hypothetical protein